jgi:hypothetical protein
MATTTAGPPKTAYPKRQDTVAGGKTDTRWAGCDANIKLVVADFNTRLGSTPGFKALEWRLVKAMVWVESGGPDNATRKLRPMQIGSPGDAGLAALLSDKEGGELILTPEMNKRLATGSSGEANIKPGQKLKVRKAALRKVIAGWQALTTAFAAKRCNIRDPRYQEKLDCCLGLMPP